MDSTDYYKRRDLLPRLRNSKINPDHYEDVLRAAEGVPVKLRPGNVNGGFGIQPADADKFIREIEATRPGWVREEARAASVEPKETPHSVSATSFSAEEFKALPPAERIRLANRGAHRDDDGRVYVYARDDK